MLAATLIELSLCIICVWFTSMVSQIRVCSHGWLLLSYPYLGEVSWVYVCSHLVIGCVDIGDEDIVVIELKLSASWRGNPTQLQPWQSYFFPAIVNVFDHPRQVSHFYCTLCSSFLNWRLLSDGDDDYERSINWLGCPHAVIDLHVRLLPKPASFTVLGYWPSTFDSVEHS
ncbi:hypothetical protein Tco_0709066 [Tanacetum coccineum]